MDDELNERIFQLAELAVITSSIVHDIRNFLSVIKGNAEVGLKLSQDSKAKEKFEKIIDTVKRAEMMVENFRKLYKGDIHYGKFSVNESIDFVLNLLKEKLEGVSIHVDIPDKIDCWGNKTLFEQIIINLITNARDALETSDSKEIVICVGEDDDCVSVYIGDSGVGIENDIKERIFEPTFTTKQHGTGLGLFIVRKILSAMNGEIKLLSESEKEKLKDEKLRKMKTIFKVILKKETCR